MEHEARARTFFYFPQAALQGKKLQVAPPPECVSFEIWYIAPCGMSLSWHRASPSGGKNKNHILWYACSYAMPPLALDLRLAPC